jgi:hypothetical protein
MNNKKIRSASLLSLSLLCSLTLASCGESKTSSPSVIPDSSSSAPVATKAHIVLSSAVNGSISISGLAADGMVDLSTELAVTVSPDEGYELVSLHAGGLDIKSTRKFTPNEAKEYAVVATFGKVENPGKTLLMLKGDFGLEVGKTMKLDTIVYGPNANVSYSSSDDTIATVDANGVVTGHKAGFASVKATSALSTDDNPLTASFTFFVEPTYIARMVDSFTSYDLGDGLSFTGDLKLTSAKANDAATSKDSVTDYAYVVNMKKDAQASSILDAFNFDLGLEKKSNTITDLILGGVLSGVTGNMNLINFKSIHLSCIGGGNCDFTATIPDPDDSTKQDYAYCETISLQTILPKLASLISSASSSSSSVSTVSRSAAVPSLGGIDIPSIISKIDFSTYLPILNGLLVMDDTDGTKGISINPAILPTLQGVINQAKASAISAISKTGVSESLVSSLFPAALSDIRFTVDLDESGAFKDFGISMKDVKKIKDSTDSTGTATVDYPYDYFTADCKKAAAPAADYFTNLSTTLDGLEADATKVNKVLSLKAELDSYLSSGTMIMDSSSLSNNPLASLIPMDNKYSVYNALLSSDGFKSVLPTYNTAYKALTVGEDALTNKQMVNPILASYGPYYSFHAKKSGIVLADKAYSAQVGDVISLGDEAIFGSEDTLSSAMTYTVEGLSTLDDFDDPVGDPNVTFDATNKTLTVVSLPTEARYVTVTADVPDDTSFRAVSFRFLLPAAKVATK